jgi:hypothetical protein
MHDIEMHAVSDEFACCWQAAGRHIQTQVQGPLHSWLKASLNPPFLEHLSFRLGNQLFFIRIEDVEGKIEVPGNRRGLQTIADGCNGHACLMPMRCRAGTWVPDAPGWGLLNTQSGALVDPVTLISDERIEMTEWELLDFAIQIVRDHLKKAGRKLMSWTSHPEVNPSIWFVGDSGPEWIVVRAVRYPQMEAKPPENWQQIAERCARLGKVGHFASVSVANADDAFDTSGSLPAMPLWRGHRMLARFEGLVSGPVQSA